MHREERLIGLATLGLAMVAVGVFLPWARVGGQARSGISTADTFIRLSNRALPDALVWVGRWWYVPAVLVVLTWASLLLRGTKATRAVAIAAVTIALIMWWLFVWAADNYNVLDVRLLGPVVATVGAAVVGGCAGQRRASILRPDPTAAAPATHDH